MMRALRIHVHVPARGHDALKPDIERIQEHCQSLGAVSLSVGGDDAPLPGETAVLYDLCGTPAAAARQAAPGLRWMQITSAGVEKHMKGFPAGLLLTNASGVHARKGGEYALAAALMLNYRIPKFVQDRAERRWEPVFGPTLSARTVTLLGTGSIGTGAALALRPTGCNLIGVNRSGRSDAPVDRCFGVDALDEVLAQTDILVSTLPLTALTDNLVDRRRVDLLPDGAGVVVLGRAKVLDYDALYDRLDAGTLSGAVLEVFSQEPVPASDRMWTTRGIIASPHCNVDDHSTYARSCDTIFLTNLERFLSGKPLENLVDPSFGY